MHKKVWEQNNCCTNAIGIASVQTGSYKSCNSNDESFRRLVLTLMLFLARGIIAGVFQAAYVYTPEVYPTSLRAVGVGSCSAMARLGAMVTPYVAQVCVLKQNNHTHVKQFVCRFY